ncbi:MAG TPA: hypothetical protein VKZ53_32375 [Candidatus Angelobacter sp.]|nr:hypothetical protein [Candidatus Angelobacter sp.]
MSEQPKISPDDSADAGETEREELTREIQDELRRQKLRDEILATLREDSGVARFARLSKHPAFLVFVSFALTGLIGGGRSLYVGKVKNGIGNKRSKLGYIVLKKNTQFETLS